MDKKEVKTSIEGLEVGMFVSRLDRPWLDTPFLIEGLKLKSHEDIELVGKYCSYVFIDVEKGQSPKARFRVVDDYAHLKIAEKEDNIFSKPIENEYTRLKKCIHETETHFKEEMETAKEISENVKSATKKIFTDLNHGKNLDINTIKKGVIAIVDSVIRNPSAFMLVLQLEKTDHYAYSHALGVSVWCAQFGRHLGLERSEINELALGGMLLDIGKMHLSKALFEKTDNFTEDDCIAMRKHVDLSVKILLKTLKSDVLPHTVMRMVATHHERADGSGYPLNLINDDIPIFGRIAGIVDSYDAMTSVRPFSSKFLTPHEAIAELYDYRGKLFQAELVEQFIQTVGLYPTGTLVEFDTEEVGIVLEINDLKRLRPTVMMILDKNKIPYDDFHTLNLSESDSGMKVTKGLPAGSYGINMNELFI